MWRNSSRRTTPLTTTMAHTGITGPAHHCTGLAVTADITISEAAAKGSQETPVFAAPTFSQDLKIKVTFYYEDDSRQVKLLTQGAQLKSGQRVGVAFRPETDCYVYILWWDSRGAVGRLFPNPKLTEGSGEVKAGQTYWLPSKQGGAMVRPGRQSGRRDCLFLGQSGKEPADRATV